MRVRRGESARWQQVPPGARDLVPVDAEWRREITRVLRDEFGRWGYREVRTPTLEYLETIVRGAGPGVSDQLFKIVDSGGALLALRPEMTVPIARMAATRLLPAARALRLAYVAEVFRGQEPGQGRLREFTQAGVELLGEGSLDGDAEVIALAAATLRRVGVTGAIVNVGHLGFLTELMADLPEEVQEDVRRRLYRKDFPSIEEVVANRPLGRVLRKLPELHGPQAISLAREFADSPKTQAALDDLESVLERLREYGVADQVGVDLGIIRDFTYYTGIVFEAYGPGMGYPLLGGGRYDRLLGRFGVESPATGFALGVERAMAVLAQDPAAPFDLLLVAARRSRSQAISLAMELRHLGLRVILDLGRQWSDAVRRAETEGLLRVGQLDGETVRVHEVRTNAEKSVNRAELVAELATKTSERFAWSR